MSQKLPTTSWLKLLLALVFLASWATLLMLPESSFLHGLSLWLSLLFGLLWIWLLFGMSRRSPAQPNTPRPPRMLFPEEQPESIRQVMDVHLAMDQDGVQVFRGPLREPADQAYDTLKHSISDRTIPLIQQDEEMGASILLMPRRTEQEVLQRPRKTWINWLLLGLTFITTTWAGSAQRGVDLLQNPWQFTVGLPYAIGLLSILGVHELGHYFTARHHGMNVTPPYFIPVPFALGTFGAFIQMRSPPENRRALFDVAVAGPLAGLVIAIPALYIGLQSSQIIPDDANLHGTSVSSSILFALISKLSLGATWKPAT